ncbi:MAG TPA: hypothetical protein VGM56_31975 [Byssovorax sp.]|jgi:hypothetical protein
MDSSAAKNQMIIGALICVVGVVVTVVSYSSASGGSRYIFAWGAIIFGAFRFVRGLVALNQAKR